MATGKEPDHEAVEYRDQLIVRGQGGETHQVASTAGSAPAGSRPSIVITLRTWIYDLRMNQPPATRGRNH